MGLFVRVQFCFVWMGWRIQNKKQNKTEKTNHWKKLNVLSKMRLIDPIELAVDKGANYQAKAMGQRPVHSH